MLGLLLLCFDFFVYSFQVFVNEFICLLAAELMPAPAGQAGSFLMLLRAQTTTRWYSPKAVC